ncbi:hemagglutinin [Paraburkholderia sp. 5N]|uniref:Hemagglutinin n=1 Tax=Paraburkholderia elongata TaxID=2675747 RepID=A0A972NNQ2_9BURK|nr:hemagglutinin [Paraburkholderia elongata]
MALLAAVAATGIDAIVNGQAALASDLQSFAADSHAMSEGFNSVAGGSNAIAGNDYSVALGSGSIADRVNTGSVGSYGAERQITSVAAGTAATGSVNVGQLNQTNQNVTNVAGNLANVTNNLANVTNTVSNVVNNGGADSPFVAFGVPTDNAMGGSNPRTDTAPANAAARGSTAVGRGSFVNASATQGTAIGELAEVDGAGGIALGTAAVSVARFSTALGAASSATGFNSVALGQRSVADRDNTVSVGSSTLQRQIANVAAGTQNTDAVNLAQIKAMGANVDNSGNVWSNFVAYDDMTMGKLTLKGANGTKITGLAAGTVAAGSTDAVNGAQLYNTANSVAATLGGGTAVNRDGTISAPGYVISGSTYANVGDALQAINIVAGDPTDASKYVKVVSVASAATASGGEAVAIGGSAFASGNGAVAIGSRAAAGYANSTAIGTNAMTYAANTVSVGSRGAERRITNLASGRDMTDAATVGQVYDILIGTNSSTASQLNALQTQVTQNAQQTSGVKSMLLGAPSVTSYIAVSENVTPGGTATTTSGDMNAMAIGPVADAEGIDALAVGAGAYAAANEATAVGSSANARSLNSTAIGAGASVGVMSDNSLAIGYNANVVATNAMAMGTGAIVQESGGVAIGYNAKILKGATNSMAFGVGATASQANSIALGNDSVADRVNAISVGSTAQRRQIINVAAGTFDSDAATVGQLKSVNAALGGGAAINQDGSITSPAYVIGGTTYNDVGAALASIATDSIAASADALQYDTAKHDVATLGNAGTPVKLTNVADGALNAGSSDAVTGAQMYDTNQAVEKNTADMASMTTNIDNGAIGLVQQDSVSRDLTVAKGTDGKHVDFTGTAGSRELLGVAAGTTAGSAVNLGQISPVVSSLGGGATVNADGSVTRPTYHVQAGTQTTVGGALSSLDTNLSLLQTQINAGGIGLVTQDPVSHDLLVGAATDGMHVNMAGTSGNRAISGVAPGAINAISDQAVNGSQLFATNEAVAQNASDIAANTGSITNLDQRVTDNTTQITNLDARTTTIEGDVSNITNQITNGEIGLVQQDQTSRNLTVAKDTDGASVDFTGTSGVRELTGIAAGTTDTSAVNVGQIKPMVTALGGGAQINADGSLTGPTYHLQGATQTTVGDALGSLDTGLTTLQQNMETGGIGIVTQDPVSRTINVGATTDGSLINLAGTSGNRVLTGVAPGAVNAASTDAVNGSQLYTHAASTAVALGGGSTVNPDGSVTAPSYNVGGTVVSNVGSAITNLDGRVTQNTSDIAGLQTTIGNISGSVANALQYDSSAHDKVTLGGTAANAPKVTLTNLQDGEVSATSTDAVTGAQLWNTNQQIGNLGQQIGDLGQSVKNTQVTGSSYVAVNSTGNAAQAIGNGTVAIGGGAKASAPNSVAIGEGSVADQSNTVSVGSTGNERRITNVAAGQAPGDAVNMQQFQGGMNDIARNAYSGTASAIALTMVPEVDANKNLAIGVGTAGYKGYQAVAVGLSARVTQSLKVKLGAGISSAATTVGAGAAYQW